MMYLHMFNYLDNMLDNIINLTTLYHVQLQDPIASVLVHFPTRHRGSMFDLGQQAGSARGHELQRGQQSLRLVVSTMRQVSVVIILVDGLEHDFYFS